MNSEDYGNHEALHKDPNNVRWMKGRDGSEFCAVKDYPYMEQLLRGRGQAEMFGFVFRLGQNGKWISRRKPFG
jgi:hypothetical protein